MKFYIVSVASSSEYGSDIHVPQIFKTKKEALRALSAEYKSAVNEFSDCEHIDKIKKPMSFEVADYDCHMDCISGKITECEI